MRVNAICSRANASALFSGKFEYEYLTGENLGYKPGVFEPGKFEYSQLGQIFNKGFKKGNKKDGILKILKRLKVKMKNSYR